MFMTTIGSFEFHSYMTLDIASKKDFGMDDIKQSHLKSE